MPKLTLARGSAALHRARARMHAATVRLAHTQGFARMRRVRFHTRKQEARNAPRARATREAGDFSIDNAHSRAEAEIGVPLGDEGELFVERVFGSGDGLPFGARVVFGAAESGGSSD